MGNQCCRAGPSASDAEGVQKPPQQHRQQNGHLHLPPATAIAHAASDAGGGGGGGGAAAALLLTRSSLGWHSADGGAFSDVDDEWHDALSEVDLAEVLEEWEEEQGAHVPEVDQAIQVLKHKGRLLPPDLEALATEQREAEIAAEHLHMQAAVTAAAGQDAAALVQVQAAAAGQPAAAALKLPHTRPQQLRSALGQEAAAGQLLQQAAELAAGGRVLAAHRLLQQLANRLGSSLDGLALLPPGALADLLPAGTRLDVAGVVGDVQRVHESLEQLEDHSGWMKSRDDKLKVYYRHHKGTTVHSLKFRAVLEHPLEHVLAMVNEFDLVVTWNKFSLASLVLARPSIYDSYVYGAQWMMKPFKNMQALLRARGFDLADEHRCLLVTLEDCPPEQLPQDAQPLPKEWGSRRLINILHGSCIKLRPLPAASDGTSRTEAGLMVHLDPHIPYLPAFLLNFVLGVLAPYVFNQVCKILDTTFADPQGIYSQRIADQPQLYGLARQRLAEFEGELAAEAAAAAAAEADGRHGARQRKKTS